MIFWKYLITVFGTISHGKWNTNSIQTLGENKEKNAAATTSWQTVFLLLNWLIESSAYLFD